MAIHPIPVDQRVIDIDSRRFASVEKALVELITNSDESYARMEKAGIRGSGRILIEYERHRRGALLVVTDQAEGMSCPVWERHTQIVPERIEGTASIAISCLAHMALANVLQAMLPAL